MFMIGEMANDNGILAFVAFALVCFAGAIVVATRTAGPKTALANWAKQNNLELLKAKRHYCLFKPFKFIRSTAQPVYRIRVRNAQGKEHSGFARCGGFFGRGNYVKVAWDIED